MAKRFELSLCSLSTPNHATNVNSKCTCKLFFCNCIKWCSWRNTCIVHDNIQISKMVNNFLESCSYFCLFGYISNDRKSIFCGQLSNCFFSCFSIVVQYSDLEAILHQTFCDCKTDSLTSTCDNSYFRHMIPPWYQRYQQTFLSEQQGLTTSFDGVYYKYPTKLC